MYPAVISRPDIMHVLSRLSQFNCHPHEEHFAAAKHVLRYLKNDSYGKIVYKHKSDGLVCYTDADWGNDLEDRKSYSGYVAFLSDGPVAWESKKQSVVALSTMEAEYIALCQGTKEIVFQRNLLHELEFGNIIQTPTAIHCDNQSASFLVKNPTIQKRSKHIDIRFHYVKQKFHDNTIEVKYVSSDKNVADILTKTLDKQKHTNNCKMLNIM